MANEISYKEAVTEIEKILAEINSAELDVDNLSKMVVRANELLEICKKKLEKAQKEVEKVNEKKAK